MLAFKVGISLFVFTLAALAHAFSPISDGLRQRRNLAPAAMTLSEYGALRTCAESRAENGEDVATCFPILQDDEKLNGLIEMGLPSIVLVPDCDESVHVVCNTSQGCSAHFAACGNARTPPAAELLGPKVGDSAYAVEAAASCGAGPYARLVRALLHTGYEDKVTLRAAAWDAGNLDGARIFLSWVLQQEPRLLLVARGFGCALAASTVAFAAATVDVADVKVLCLGAAPDPVPDAALHAHELGLMVRRRGRPLPIVHGPWGDGTVAGSSADAGRCGVRPVQAPVDKGTATVYCAGDCKRWVIGAKHVDCRTDGTALQRQLECLVSAI